jgi:hypothetical protein
LSSSKTTDAERADTQWKYHISRLLEIMSFVLFRSLWFRRQSSHY